MGGAIIKYLTDTPRGREIIKKHKLDIAAMRDILSTDTIRVVDGVLKDDTDSVVDARFIHGKIELHKSTWENHFNGRQDIYYLVGHEIFRATKIFDKDYVVSNPALFPFPEEFKVKTRLMPEYPLLPGELLRNVLLSEKLIFTGSGCPANTSGTYVDFDYESNVINITMYELGAAVGRMFSETQTRRVCMLNFPIVIPEKKRLLITQMDVATQLGLPGGSKLQLRTEIYLAGRQGKVFEKVIEPKLYIWGKTLIRENDVLQSDCGKASHLLNIVTSSKIEGNTLIPTISNSTKQKLYLKLVDCEA